MRHKHTDPALLLLLCLPCYPALAEPKSPSPDALLLQASKRGDLPGMKAALAAGASPNATDSHDRTALELVSYEGRIYDQARTPAECGARLNGVKLLVERGAKVAVGAEEYFPYHIVQNAFLEGRYDIAQLLLNHGGDPNAQNLPNLLRPPRFPTGKPDPLRRKLFEEALARTHGKDQYASLVDAVSSDDGGYFTRRLLEAGYDPNTADYTGMTPLLTAIQRGRPQIVALLLKYKVHVDQQYKTPNSSYSVMKFGLAGKTPLRVAREEKQTRIAELLKKAGAKE